MTQQSGLFIPVLSDKVRVHLSLNIEAFRKLMAGSDVQITEETFINNEYGIGLWSYMDVEHLCIYANLKGDVGTVAEVRARLANLTKGVWRIVQDARGIQDADSPTALWCMRAIYDCLEQAYMEQVLQTGG